MAKQFRRYGCSQFESSFGCSLSCEDRFLLLSDFDLVKVRIMPWGLKMNFRQFHKYSKLSCCMSFGFVNLQLWSVYYATVALLLLLLLCTILHSFLLLALMCSYYYLTTATLLSYIYYSAMYLIRRPYLISMNYNFCRLNLAVFIYVHYST